MADPADIDMLQGWIGRSETISERLEPGSVARFNALFNRGGDLSDGAAAPLMIHYCLCLPVVPLSELAADGHPARGGFLPPVRLPRRMWAGSRLDWSGAFRIGQTIRRTSTILDIRRKEGRSGPLCFVTVAHDYAGDGAPLLHERQDLVYRATAAPDAGRAETARAPAGDTVRRLAPSPPLLFGYSALTGNSHRIHYDAPYARGVEGYPGLLVHGPLQATLLALFAGDLEGTPPAGLTVRALTPVFDTAELTLNARAETGGMTLWTASDGGPTGMEVRAEWAPPKG